MPNFSYKALGRDGKEVRGVLQAESEAAAASRIRESYPILLSISQKKEKKRPDEGSLLEMEIGSRRIKTKKLAILCSQFALTLHSGMTVAHAMRMLADQNEDKRIRKILGAAAEEVAAGSTVASALEKYSDRFPLTFIETIRAGEQSGTLERSFDRLQKFYEICRSGRYAAADDADADRDFPFLCEVVATDAGGAGVFEDWFAGLRQYAAGTD